MKFNSRTHKSPPPKLNYGLSSLPPHTHPQRPNFGASPRHRIDRVETPEQRRRRELQAEILKVQKAHLRDRLYQRWLKAEQRGDTRLIRELSKEWQELFPDAPSLNSPEL